MPNSVVCEDIGIENVGNSIYICRVNIKDLEAVIKVIVDSVIDISWINNLPTRLHKGLLAAATPAIEYIKGLCNNIKEANDTGITVNENEAKQKPNLIIF